MCWCSSQEHDDGVWKVYQPNDLTLSKPTLPRRPFSHVATFIRSTQYTRSRAGRASSFGTLRNGWVSARVLAMEEAMGMTPARFSRP